MNDRATKVALLRYSLIREAADPALSKTERGALVREIAEMSHLGPDGDAVSFSRATLDRWIRAWRRGGFEALKPTGRAVEPRTPEAFLSLATDLRKENPARTAAHIAELIRTAHGWSPAPRTLQRHFAASGLARHAVSDRAMAFGRFEASRPNELWVGDALHGPVIAGKKAILFAFLDDHSRAFTGYRWVYSEDTLRAEAALRWGLASRGVPSICYLDNGSPYVSSQLARALAVMGIRLIHSRPGRPEGRGKIERVFRSVREQFLVEVPHAKLATLQDLNEAFSAWVETVYHMAVHRETNMAPLTRFLSGGAPALPSAELLAEAFKWSESRTVTKTATVSLFSNSYEVDAVLVGRRVELVFDPFDLAKIEVRYSGRPMGNAVPMHIGRHTHPQAKTEAPAPPPVTGIDYLGLVLARQHEELERRTSYAGLRNANTALDNDTEEAR